MNIDNRRLREVRREKEAYTTLMDCSECMSDILMYQGKIECLEREEKEILARYNVVIEDE